MKFQDITSFLSRLSHVTLRGSRGIEQTTRNKKYLTSDKYQTISHYECGYHSIEEYWYYGNAFSILLVSLISHEKVLPEQQTACIHTVVARLQVSHTG